MHAKALPPNPNLDHYRKEAKRLLKDAKAGVPAAIQRLRDHHPRGTRLRPESTSSTTLILADAQIVIAREHGVESWPKFKDLIETVNTYSRSPHKEPSPTDAAADPVDEFLRLACLTYGNDHPSRRETARQLLTEHPEITRASIYTAATVGDLSTARELLMKDPALVRAKGGPHDWEPLLYAAYSRLNSGAAGHSTLEVARLLLQHGADPNAGYLWEGLPSPFTALTGAFGEGEAGPVNQPPHECCYDLARSLLDAGADPNDSQALYNRQFSRDDGHLRLLFEYGMGKDRGGPWRIRLGEKLDTPAQLLVEQLWAAAASNFPERVRLLVEHGVDVNATGSRDGRTPYQVAILNGNGEIADYLRQHGAKQVALNPEDELTAACSTGDCAQLRTVLMQHAGLLERLDAKARAELLMRVAQSGRPEAVCLLVELGVDVNATTTNTALHQAAWRGDLEMAKLLVELGADIAVRDASHNATPLDWARYNNQPAVAEFLMSIAGNPDAFVAAQRGDVIAAQALLRSDPSLINSRDEQGHGLLYVAAMYGFNARQQNNRAFIEFLIQEGAEVDLYAAAFLARPDRVREILHSNPNAVNQAMAPGACTALHYAAERGDLETVRALVEGAANLNVRDKSGRTPLVAAAHAGPWKPTPAGPVIEYLLKQGAALDLFAAAALGNEVLLDRLAARGAQDLNARDAGGCTALWHAAHNNRLDAVRWLIERGASVNTANADGQTPFTDAVLHLLSQEADPKLIRYLIEQGAAPNACAAAALGDVELLRRILRERPEAIRESLGGYSPSYYALHCWKPDCLRELGRAGASLANLEADLRRICGERDPALLTELLGRRSVESASSAKDNIPTVDPSEGWTPLHLAAMRDDVPAVQALLDGGMAVDGLDARGKSPFFWAIIKRSFSVAELLLKRGAEVNARWRGYSLLHHEAKDGKAETVAFLLDHGADPNIRDDRVQPGSTPLHGAARQDRVAVAKLLIAHGADVNTMTDIGQTPADAARASKKQKVLPLLQPQAGTETKGRGKNHPIFYPAGYGDAHAVAEILDKEPAAVHVRSAAKMTPLQVAASRGHANVATVLLDRGADVTGRDSPEVWPPLVWAAYRGHIDVVKLLLERGADPTGRGGNPIHYAGQRGHREICKLLVDRGAIDNLIPTGDADMLGLFRAAYSYDAAAAEHVLTRRPELARAVDKVGRTPLHEVCTNDDLDTAKVLLRFGARPKAKDESGETPLDRARKHGKKNLTKLLSGVRSRAT